MSNDNEQPAPPKSPPPHLWVLKRKTDEPLWKRQLAAWKAGQTSRVRAAARKSKT